MFSLFVFRFPFSAFYLSTTCFALVFFLLLPLLASSMLYLTRLTIAALLTICYLSYVPFGVQRRPCCAKHQPVCAAGGVSSLLFPARCCFVALLICWLTLMRMCICVFHVEARALPRYHTLCKLLFFMFLYKKNKKKLEIIALPEQSILTPFSLSCGLKVEGKASKQTNRKIHFFQFKV